MLDAQTTTLLEIINNPKYTAVLLLLMIWSLAWKGVALWRAAQANQRNWFIGMLVINTIGILEIVYLFYFHRRGQNTKNNANKEKNLTL